MAKKATITFDGAKMTPEGMMYNGFLCQPVVEQCQGCDRTQGFEGQDFCTSYPMPASKWTMGRCNLATHVKREMKAGAKVNPLKASKRASKGK